MAALGGLDLIEARFAIHATSMHSHEEVEIGMVVAGSRLVVCGQGVFHVPAPSIVVFRPGDFHAGSPVGVGGSTYRSFLVRQGTLAAECEWTGPGWFATPVVSDHRLTARLFAAHPQLRGPDTSADLVRSLFRELGQYRLPAAADLPAEDGVVRRAREYLDRSYAATVRLSTVAEFVGVSVFHLIRSFRRTVGLPPYAYLEQVRIHHAVRLLRDGHQATQVAFLTGFADQSHLTRFFKRFVGVPPGRYQQSARWAATSPAPR